MNSYSKNKGEKRESVPMYFPSLWFVLQMLTLAKLLMKVDENSIQISYLGAQTEFLDSLLLSPRVGISRKLESGARSGVLPCGLGES